MRKEYDTSSVLALAKLLAVDCRLLLFDIVRGDCPMDFAAPLLQSYDTTLA